MKSESNKSSTLNKSYELVIFTGGVRRRIRIYAKKIVAVNKI